MGYFTQTDLENALSVPIVKAVYDEQGKRSLVPTGEADVLVRLAAGERIGTHLQTTEMKTTARKQWLADHLQLRGKLSLDAGAIKVLKLEGKSLLAIGVTAVEEIGRAHV